MISEHCVVRFPTRLLAITLGLTLATFSWVVWAAFVNHRNLPFQSAAVRLEKLSGVAMHLDEVLTMSARMMAATGESRWEQRYRQYEPELGAAIKETMALASGVSAIAAPEQTDVANAKLVAMENRAFALVRDGRSREARALLSSAIYEDQKAIYAGGMNAFVTNLRARIDTLDRQTYARATLSIAGLTVLFGLSMGAWIAVIGSLRRTQRDLVGEVDDRTAELRETADYLQNLIGHANAPIVVWNPAFEITRFNRAFERLTGRGASEVIGKGLEILFPEDKREEWVAHLRRTATGERWETIELPIQQVDGSIRTLLWNSATLFDSDGRTPIATIAQGQDITGRKQAEEALRASEARNRTVLETAMDGFWRMDLQGRLMEVNEAYCRMSGYREQELLGMSVSALEVVETPAEIGGRIQQIMAKGELRFESRHRRRDGSIFDVEISVQYRPEEGDQFVVFLHDITQRRRAEKTLTQTNQTLLAEITERQKTQVELAEARDVALEATRLKAEFLANMSHEIRTPMNGVIGMTELALDTELTVQQREYLDMAKGSADSLLRIVNDVLDFSKIEAGRLVLDPAEFRLRDTIDDTLKPLALRAHKKGLELFFDVQGDVPDTLVADAGRLRQVLVNLVGNAIKFTSAGEVLVTVWVEPQDAPDADDAVLHVAVSDTGIGIPMDKQAMVFDAFNQADGSITRTYGGTGLGLTISANLVQMMGGRIWVESTPGRGTTFHFTLGVRVQETQALEEAVPAALVGLSVLVVDDNATNRRILEKTLEKWQMRPTLVASGEAALTAVRQAHDRGHPFRVMLLDVAMPGMDGFTVATRLNEDHTLAAPAIVILTSSGEAGDAARCREIGAAAYLVKPVKQAVLREAVLTALGRPSSGRVVAPPPAPLHGRSLRILLAEDNVVNQRVAIGVLEAAGHAVTLAVNGKDALAAVEGATFDLVLMDEQMPEMSGSEATAAIRARERVRGGHLPIIALTARALVGDRERSLAAGADGYVAKPIARAELFGEIDRVTSRNAAPPTPATPTATFDEGSLLARVGGNRELLQEVIGLFLEDCPRLLDAVRQALTDRDADAVYRATHTLKGSAGNFGGPDVIAVIQRLEASAREGDLSACGRVFTLVETTIGRLTGELTAVREVAPCVS